MPIIENQLPMPAIMHIVEYEQDQWRAYCRQWEWEFPQTQYYRADLVDNLLAAVKQAKVSMRDDENRRLLFDAIAEIEEHRAA